MIDVEPLKLDDIMDIPKHIPVSTMEHWCEDCATVVAVHQGWHPITAYFQMVQHWATVEHPRFRVEKSVESGLWLVKRGDLILVSCSSQRVAMVIAFERHPWTIKERKQARLNQGHL